MQQYKRGRLVVRLQYRSTYNHIIAGEINNFGSLLPVALPMDEPVRLLDRHPLHFVACIHCDKQPVSSNFSSATPTDLGTPAQQTNEAVHGGHTSNQRAVVLTIVDAIISTTQSSHSDLCLFLFTFT